MGKSYPMNASRSRATNRNIKRILITSFGVLLLFWYLSRRSAVQAKLYILKELNLATHTEVVEKGIVIPKVKGEDVSWILDSPEWTPFIYSASFPPEPGFRPLPALRGREAMAYLTFIIENYDHLPLITAFVHAGATQWHNDILGAYTSSILNNLRTDSVTRLGYVNLRCSPEPGCPTSVNLLEPSLQDVERKDVRAYFAEIYMELFDVGKDKVPRHVGHTCCAQFAVTRERIRARPKSDYERMRRWITEGSVGITDTVGVGWVFEVLWHVIFGMDALHCPSFKQCRCDLFGWCDDSCPEEFKPLVMRSHPWLGLRLGDKWGNVHAAGWENCTF